MTDEKWFPPMPVIAVLALDGVPGHHLTVPGLVFGTACREHPDVTYEVRMCAPEGRVKTAAPAPLGVAPPYGLDGLSSAEVILIPTHGVHRAEPPPAVRAALHAAADRGSRIAAVGTGTFTLAATGLLDGRCATTSWRYREELAARHPRVTVDPLGTVVEDGPFLTAAGVFGGMDVCLHVLARDHGRQVAGETSRELITPLHPYADDVRDTIARELAESAGLEPILAWMRSRLHTALTLTDVATHARTSPSSLTRRFRAHTGLAPLQYLLRIRLLEAQRLLEETDVPVEQVATNTGFTSPAVLRRHFRDLTGTTPRDYRRNHRARSG
ncbi:Transcriptional regulator GlxA family, contains an amidase domain and an AraC-type DNA-binding HTH domain [Saccharopolyspora shandongensis]|uniref:Transcriptional regulator GlxA family, contains an amidase domain and an AraC-type DNA-binding HTH domain n=1 Tax=Saccharopolyspora shandongensis TaxID=418495 RepID=A0A1H3EAN8_9PSEU|nr:helix-turn-helix domain-containing protein [Saccharopolyspora shandongensis]SDX75725.1 Transcriptional regulator GlxA family, contains an amidase domain and an AraC-type DNA-binding HTH domain [Saccharopolyspora shandongensis]